MPEASSTTTWEPITLPTARRGGCPFDPPPELARLREERPLRRLSFPDGHLGWLVTSHALARTVMADPRFSARMELRHTPIHRPVAERLTSRPAPPGFFIAMDPPDHTHYRRLLTGQFTVRRMNQLHPWIERVVEEHLDAMEQAGPPVDLVEAFALPIPSLVICELLGVPYADRDDFQRHSSTMVRLDTGADEGMAAMAALTAYLRELAVRKRAEPTDDMLSGLAAHQELNEDELAGMALLLLVAGHETTANMIGLGTFALLQHPAQAEALRSDPALTDGAVEELMRYLTVIHNGTGRAALEDVELDGELIREGENVWVSLSAANRDPARFSDPDELDLGRAASGHLGFGHGVHQCLGQQLARIELRSALPALFRRFPTLRLAVPAEEVPTRTDMNIYGVHRLPVAW
ncbi:cytochrome P450 [Allostreptomyces psammosilenae]|uniref:Cytochrome P450 n=1 Tax=Allostreptomyces psammosilenae TaxID=1892865 RepID=A0A853A4W5_9ACTN|nr:cytochrome P450 [Allostreptomyces psammosilenae]NYI07914.1 cytochrome P450 [Allostreptomyces psammosilenae]